MLLIRIKQSLVITENAMRFTDKSHYLSFAALFNVYYYVIPQLHDSEKRFWSENDQFSFLYFRVFSFNP